MNNVLEVKEQYINGVVVYNPLEPSVSRKLFKLVWDYKKTLYDYIKDLPSDCEWLIVYNGKSISLDEAKNIAPIPDSWLAVSPLLLGGGRNSGGKQTLRMITTIALIVIAVVATVVFPPAGMTLWAAIGSGLALGGSIGGLYYAASSMIWNKPVGTTNIEPPSNDTYGVDGAQAVATEGIPVGLCYGTYRVAGNIIQMRTQNVGDTQDVYLLQLLSEGEVESISDILVNDQELSAYYDIDTEVRRGLPNQEIIPWFDDTYVSEYQGTEITTQWQSKRTKNKLEKFRLDVMFPYGLYYSYTTKAGSTHSVGGWVDFEVEYKSITEDATKWKKIGSQVHAYINNILTINDGDKFVFVDEQGVKRTFAFYNVLYKDFDAIYDENNSEKVKEIIVYVQVGANTQQSINNFKSAFSKNYNPIDSKGNIVEITAPKLLISQELYTSGLYNLTFTPTDSDRNYSAWQLTVENTEATATSFQAAGGSAIRLTGFSQSAFRRTIESPKLPLDYYDIRIRRIGKAQHQTMQGTFTHTIYNDAQWLNVSEIILDDIQYNNSAIMGVKVRLDGQLSSTPNITALVKGIKCNIYDYDGTIKEKKWTANPAWIVLDMLTNARYGGNINVSRIDMAKFIEWAEYCDENKLEFNGYIADIQSLWDSVQMVTMVGHADLILCGTKFTLAIDKPREPVYLFNNSNIIKDTMSTSWSGLQDRANSFTLTYYNKDNNYKQESIKIVDSENVATQGDLVEYTTTIIGITDEKQARNELKRMALKNKYLQQAIEFEAPIECVGCSVGDVIIVQHDVPQWGYGGKLKSGSSKELLKLDRPVTMKDNRIYNVLVHHSAVKRAEVTIQSVVGKSVLIAGTIKDSIKRVINGSLDVEVIKKNVGAQLTELILVDTKGFNVGDTVQLWDTDALEEAEVVTDAYKNLQQIVLKNPLQWEPQVFDNWLFGYKDAYQKKFVITAMSGLNTTKVKISGCEYSDSFYDYDNYEGNDPIISDISRKIGPVYNLTATETLIKNGSSFYTEVKVDWETATLNTYFGADIYIRKMSDMLFEKVAEVKDGVSSYKVSNLNDNDYFEIKVVAFDGAGRRANFEQSPILQYTVEGKQKKPATPTNFEARNTTQGLMLAWDVVNEADVIGYTLKMGTEWASGEVIDDNVSNNRYTIQYSEAGVKNFMVKAKDAFGNESEEPAYTAIILEPPLDPVDFMSVQNNDFIVLKWNNLDETVTKFRIKEGESWGSGTIVADVAGYSHSVPINGYYNRKFWIKSINQFGVFSANAIYTSPQAIEHQTKNVIVEYDESGNGFVHPHLNMDLIGDNLIVRENSKYGEYNWYVDVGEKLRSRVISEDEVDAIQYSPKWKDFDNRWNSYEAQSPWVVKGSLDNVQIERQMALPTDEISPDIFESFSFFNTPDGDIKNTKPIVPSEYLYSNGRFREGIVVDDRFSLGYNIDIPEVFSVRFWVRPQKVVTSGYLQLLNTDTGNYLRLYYSQSNRYFAIKDKEGRQVTIETEFKADEPILICMSQSRTTRTLAVGYSKNLELLYNSEQLPPAGSFNQMNFR